MEFFQLRKNSTQVIRISRGPYEGHDITRVQIWWRRRGGADYLPGKTVAFNSELIPGVIEGLHLMEQQGSGPGSGERGLDAEILRIVAQVMQRHRQPLHWEVVAEIVRKEFPKTRASKWSIYNTLLSNPDNFVMQEEDVFARR